MFIIGLLDVCNMMNKGSYAKGDTDKEFNILNIIFGKVIVLCSARLSPTGKKKKGINFASIQSICHLSSGLSSPNPVTNVN